MDRVPVGIIEHETGILEKNGIFFSSPDEFAQNNLFCLYWGATYVCIPPYKVNRKGIDACLLFEILEGNMYFKYSNNEFMAKRGDIVLINCLNEHFYEAVGKVKFRWFHFAGNASKAFCDAIEQKGKSCIKATVLAEKAFWSIIESLERGDTRFSKISSNISIILSEMYIDKITEIPEDILKAQKYIEEHFSEDICVEDVAKFINMSRFHFSRVFKEKTGNSPHGYLANLRIENAKGFLAETDDTIENVSLNCGFASTSHFIRAFKLKTGLTPAKFRTIVR